MNPGREDRHPHVIAIVDKIKSQGIFDALRKECLADADTKPAYQNLRQKVENACASFLSRIVWSSQLNKNQLREQMRKNLEDSGVLQSGVKRIVNQVVTPRIDNEVKPKVAQVVCEYLGLDPDDIHTEDDEEGPEEMDNDRDYSQAPGVPVGLYPFNPLEPPPQINGPPPLPGFDEYEKYPSHAPPPPGLPGDGEVNQFATVQEVRFEEPQAKEIEENKSADKQDDMDISEKSDSRSTSRASTKKSMDMDCTMTSDEESGAGMDGTDLSKGLAAYMAGNDGVKNDDDMSISSGSSSKRGQITPEPSDDVKSLSNGGPNSTSQERKQRRKESSATAQPAPPVERREMRRQRTRNKKYMSDDFESIFTEKRELLGETYNQQDFVEEEIITTDDMMSQVIIEEAQTASPSTEQPAANDRSPNVEKSKTNEPENSSDGFKPRRSSRHRGAKEFSPPLSLSSMPFVTVSIEDIANIKLPEGLPVKTTAETRRTLRNSKKLSTNMEAVAEPIIPRRYTRAKAKNVTELSHNESPSSTPTKVEASFAVEEAMVVLSDICAGQKRLPTPTDENDGRSETSNMERSPTPTLDESSNWTVVDEVRSASVERLDTSHSDHSPEAANNEEVDQSASKGSESYEPELHFEEMSRAFADQSGRGSSRSDVGTPTQDEPASPDRFTDSPTSPTPSSPTEETHAPEISTSMVTIPLEGDESYHSVVEESPGLPQPINTPTIPTVPIECMADSGGEPPPLPPECPPLPQECDNGGDMILPPPEPEGEDDEDDENAVYHVLSEVGVEDAVSPTEAVEAGNPLLDGEGIVEGEALPCEEEEDADDLEELERLAQRKLEILKAIELPDSMLDRTVRTPSSEEEGEISDSSEEERKSKKKKSKKSKKKKSKKESRKRKRNDGDLDSSSKRSRHY